MIGTDLIVSFVIMAILFLRQISILKHPNKINYAPLMIGIGLITSIVHFIIHPEAENFVLLIRESFFPLLVSLLLFIVMNIMHQTQEKEQDKLHDEFSRIMVEQVTQLKEFMSELEGRLTACQQDDRLAQEEIRTKFKEDIQALDSIQANQTKFLVKFDEMDAMNKNVAKKLQAFADEEMPKLSSILHEHIDILRVSEKDHFNKIQATLEKAGVSREEIADDMDEMKQSLKNMQNIAESIAQAITKHTLQQLSSVTKSFEHDINLLRSHSQSIETALLESDNRIANIKEKSELVMKQMVLSNKKMGEIAEHNSGVHELYTKVTALLGEVDRVRNDYTKAQTQLHIVTSELKSKEDEQLEIMREKVEELAEVLTHKIEESLKKLHEHYHIAEEDITKSVQLLTKKAQFQKGYTNLDK
jgi:chromosome segregation ATPase